MNKISRTLTAMTVTGLLAVSLSACSGDEATKNITPAPDKPTVSATPSETATPDASATAEPTEGAYEYPDQENIEWEYQYDISEVYDAEAVANFEEDVNNLYHYMLDGRFTDFTQAYSGDNAQRLAPLSDYMTEEAFDTFSASFAEDGDPNLRYSLVATVEDDGYITYADGTRYEVVDATEMRPVVMLPWGDEKITVKEITDENTKEKTDGVIVERNVTVVYNTVGGERVWQEMVVTYLVVPNADGHWVIDGWNRQVEYFGLQDAEGNEIG